MNCIYLETFLGYIKITGENKVESINFVSKKKKNNTNSFLKNINNQFSFYFEKQKDLKNIPINDSECSIFQRKVFQTLKEVTLKEKIISYKQLACKIKSKNYTRQVASALSKNKFPILIPCHRVIYSNGKIGNYNLGTNIKYALINFENNNLAYFKMVLPKWFNWKKTWEKYKSIPFYKVENNCISYLSNKIWVNIRFSNDCLYVNFINNLNEDKAKKEIIKMFKLEKSV